MPPPLIDGIGVNYGSTETVEDLIKEFNLIVYSESVQTVETGSGTVYGSEESEDWKAAWRSFLR